MTIQDLQKMTQPERFACFVAWLGSQPPETPYNFMDRTRCVLCKFGRTFTSDDVSAGSTDITTWDNGRVGPSVEIIEGGPGGSIAIMLCGSKTIGELHYKLTPFVPTPVALSDAQMDALESRPLVGLTIKV